ncbi:GntR family transcriptional regulator [Arsenicitalea aurantiaca]|uniref:GntR family transcriptional regulator n=1 Tax=Arsenicitalea aurantiaca TaxID=1783274 RepID=A0A433XB17_9HYPH|nr:GntR family transcriptional regulator [Arsenicitalea aurantiaca]RUT31253.1 GntR family transcriptional regulator [Arsenicitalea aurantiaca]
MVATLKMPLLPVQSQLPLYQQVESVLRKQIQSGHYAVGTIIPTEHELTRAFGVSRATVRNAIRSLTQDGFVKSKPGVGTLVIRSQKQVRAATLRGLTEDLRLRGVATRARTLKAEFEVATPAVRAKLELYKDERVLHLLRLREIAGSPFALIRSFVPESVGLTPDDDFSGPLYETIERSHRLHIIYGEDAIGVRAPTEREAELLQIERTTPILAIRRTAFVEYDRPIEYVECSIRSDLYEYNVTLSR